MSWLELLSPRLAEGEWGALIALAAGAVVIGVAKSGFGGGIGIVAVPLFMLGLPAEGALGVMLPILLCGDVAACVSHRRGIEVGELRAGLLGCLPGIAAGTVLLWWFGRRQDGAAATHNVLQGVVAVICLTMVGLQAARLAGAKFRIDGGGAAATAAAGALTGVVSTLAHAAGPIMSLWWLERGMAKKPLVATLCWFFLAVNLIKLPIFLGLGLVAGPTMAASAILLPLVLLGSLAGHWMHDRIPEKPFAALMYLAALAASLKMLVPG